MKTRIHVAASLLIALACAGCVDDEPDRRTLADLGFEIPAEMIGPDRPLSATEIDWPDFTGRTLRILDHGAFDWAFAEAAPLFENLTGARVVHTAASDTGSALNTAVLEVGDPSHDILYGIDNALWRRAVEAGVFAPYTPVLAGRVPAERVFFEMPDVDERASWERR